MFSSVGPELNIITMVQAGIIFTLLGAAADEVEEEEKKQKKLGRPNLSRFLSTITWDTCPFASLSFICIYISI